jgi:hypothetical protein
MKTECLPEAQTRHNAFLNRKLKTLLVASVLLLTGSVVALAGLYFRGSQSTFDLPQVVGPDGSSIIGNAIPLVSTLLITLGEPPEGCQVVFAYGERMPASRVRTQQITAGTTFTILRVNASVPVEMVPTLSAVESGQRATALSATHGQWDGTLVERKPGVLYDAQPALLWGPGVPVYAADRSLVGVTAQDSGIPVVVSMREILARFPEVDTGQ